jgi:hypothetical protein
MGNVITLSECSCGVHRVRRAISRKTPSWATSVINLLIYRDIFLTLNIAHTFFLAFPLSPLGLSGTFLRSACFSHFSFMWCGGAPVYFPRLPTPTLSLLLFLDDTTRIQQHTTSMGGPHPAWDSNPADLPVVSEECRSSFHHPTVSP